MDKKGFTLTELLIVVAIIGILAMIAIPAYVGQQKNATRTEAYTNLQTLRLLEEQFYAENAMYASTTGVAGADQLGNVALIQAATVLPGFKPGTDLKFSYIIVRDEEITNTSTNPPTYGNKTPCFRAVATGNTGTRVTGDTFAIDCDNDKNF
jgi:prepilin-type N-terminal cleavage/methylation domain-containing protein